MSILLTEADGLTTVQDLGRPGLAHLGVPRAGALDAPAAALANRVVGNPRTAAVIETTMVGMRFTSRTPHWFAVTGARCEVIVDGRHEAHGEPFFAGAGAQVVVGRALDGVRSYLGVAGGFDVDPVLGSRSTDTLSWTGPPRLSAGDEVLCGTPSGAPQGVETPLPSPSGPLRLWPGPRADWFATGAFEDLCAAQWVVGADSNRIGLRLSGPAPVRTVPGELASEGMVAGAVQVPPSGELVVFLADHPVTGGYPVLAVLDPRDLHRCAQVRPGERVRFSPARGA
ncbi:MAG TPA: biotin-dependent carboxyltransferase family protein [Nocardioides sp.]